MQVIQKLAHKRYMKNQKILKSFTLDNLPDLDTVVLGALELFMQLELPQIDVSMYKRPLIVGSGNAEATGRIIFEKLDAIFASESTYEEKLKNIDNIDGVVLISASGEKHAPIIAQKAKDLGKQVILLTNSPDSTAAMTADIVYSYPKNREPYTYNTSTYMAMILSATKEDAQKIYNHIIEVIDKLTLSDFSLFDRYYLIVPSRFSGIIRMLQVKFIELFGRTVARDVETAEYVAHATTVVPGDELFISFGTEAERNTAWGKEGNRLHIPLPENANYATMMAVSYYVIGKIQKVRAPLFKQNIKNYMQEVSKVFGYELKVIVD